MKAENSCPNPTGSMTLKRSFPPGSEVNSRSMIERIASTAAGRPSPWHSNSSEPRGEGNGRAKGSLTRAGSGLSCLSRGKPLGIFAKSRS